MILKTHTLPAVLLLTLLLLTGCNKGAPLPGGYAIFIASSSEILLVDKQSGGVAGANLVKIGNSGALIFGEIQLMPKRPAKDSDTQGSSSSTPPRAPSRRAFLGKTG